MSIERHDFTSGTELAQSLSEAIADKLAAAIAERGQATLAVSGGTTPLKLFDILSRKMIDWTLVTITLVDERFVAPSSERSNEKLVRDHLLHDHAGVAKFVGLYNPAATAETAALAAANRIDALRRPLTSLCSAWAMMAIRHRSSRMPTDLIRPLILRPRPSFCRSMQKVQAKSV